MATEEEQREMQGSLIMSAVVALIVVLLAIFAGCCDCPQHNKEPYKELRETKAENAKLLVRLKECEAEHSVLVLPPEVEKRIVELEKKAHAHKPTVKLCDEKSKNR